MAIKRHNVGVRRPGSWGGKRRVEDDAGLPPQGALEWCTHAAPSCFLQGQDPRSSGPLPLMFRLEHMQAFSLPFKRHVFPVTLQTPSFLNKPQYVLDPLTLVAALPKKPQVGNKREQ